MARKAQNVEEVSVQPMVEETEILKEAELVVGPSLDEINSKIQALEAELAELKKVRKNLAGGTKNVGVKEFVGPLLKEGLTNKQILDLVHKKYGNTNTTYACIAWYRNKLNKQA